MSPLKWWPFFMLPFVKSHIKDFSGPMNASDVLRHPSFRSPHLALQVLVHFPDDIFKCIFLMKIKISLKFVLKGPINNIPALVQIMAWCLSGDNPLSEPMMASLLMHICVTWPQWVKCHHFALSCRRSSAYSALWLLVSWC